MEGLIRTFAGDCDECTFPVDGKALQPCEVCGVTGLEALRDTERALIENEQAFGRYLGNQLLPLFHWSPRDRRKQILRYGLRPKMRAVTHQGDAHWRAMWICLADTPRWAWSLSGAQRSAPAGEWDLWSTSMDRLTDPRVLPADWANGIHEVRTAHRIFKRDLWLVATRTKD